MNMSLAQSILTSTLVNLSDTAAILRSRRGKHKLRGHICARIDPHMNMSLAYSILTSTLVNLSITAAKLTSR